MSTFMTDIGKVLGGGGIVRGRNQRRDSKLLESGH